MKPVTNLACMYQAHRDRSFVFDWLNAAGRGTPKSKLKSGIKKGIKFILDYNIKNSAYYDEKKEIIWSLKKSLSTHQQNDENNQKEDEQSQGP